MARAAATDPLRNFKFKVSIDTGTGALGKLLTGNETGGALNMGFSAISGLTVSNEMIAYREGGMNTHPHKMIGQSDYGPVTFSKGVFADQDQLYNWQQFLHSWSQGGANDNGSRSFAEDGVTVGNDYRCDITVSIFDHPSSVTGYASDGSNPATGEAFTDNGIATKMKYKLYNCWPASYALGDLNAGDSSLLVQQLVVNHEGFQILWADSAGGKVSGSFTS